jgi:hypothetical protein
MFITNLNGSKSSHKQLEYTNNNSYYHAAHQEEKNRKWEGNKGGSPLPRAWTSVSMYLYLCVHWLEYSHNVLIAERPKEKRPSYKTAQVQTA